MNELQAVFWDLDGTIANTEMDGHRIAFNKAFKQKGLDWFWDRDIYLQLLKVHGGFNRIKDFSIKSNEYLPDSEISMIHKIKQKNYINLINSGQINLRIGVNRLIDELYHIGIIQLVVTTSSYSAVNALLKSSLPSYKKIFKEIITYESVKTHKPHPECYLKAINITSIKPSNIIVIEDSLTGLSSASKANLKCIITLSPWINKINESFYQALSVVDHLGEDSNTCKLFHGLNIPEGIINYSYLNMLISNS